MQPNELNASSFAGYPPEARRLASTQLELLRNMPLALVPILLRELISYDWKLPAERRELNKQFTYLNSISAAQRGELLAGFRALPLEGDLAALDWVNHPSSFMENLTAWLWSTHRMEQFRKSADAYADAVNRALPPQPPSQPRLAVVMVGAGVERTEHNLFRKLRPQGVYLTGVDPRDGINHLHAEAVRRASAVNAGGEIAPVDSPFDHWLIDGGEGAHGGKLTQISYAALEKPRALLLQRIEMAIGTGSMGPEELRSLLARLQPEEIGLEGEGAQAVLNHFKLSLLTEGAGTQIFATTFVQWAARECIRRAQPETLIVRYTPRQQAQTMNLMLSGAKPQGVDLQGSLIDADQGAYYAWLAMRRLTGSDQMRFLVWFEGHSEAVAVGPGLPRGTVSDSKMDLTKVLRLFG